MSLEQLEQLRALSYICEHGPAWAGGSIVVGAQLVESRALLARVSVVDELVAATPHHPVRGLPGLF